MASLARLLEQHQLDYMVIGGLADVQGILRRRLRELDLDYLEPRIEELSNLLSRPEIWQN